MKTFGKHLLAWIAACCLMLSGCGGSGGDSSDGTDPVVSDKVERREIREDNAKEVVSEAFHIEGYRDDIDIIKSMDSAEQSTDVDQSDDESDSFYLLDLSMSVKNDLDQIDFKTVSESYETNASPVKAATAQRSKTITGENGGTALLTIDIDTESGDFSGSISYSDYCDKENTINGQCNVNGAYDLDKEEISWLEMSFDNFTSESASDSNTINGKLKIEQLSANEQTFSMDLKIHDNNSDRIYEVENYKMNLTTNDGHTELMVNGRFTKAGQGYVEIETTSPLVKENMDTYYSSGVFEVVGKEGEAGQPTMARLTAVSNTEFRVEADTTGDGNFDYDTGNIFWEDLDKIDSDDDDSDDDSSDDDSSDDKKLLEVHVDACFELSSGSIITGPVCDNEDFHFRKGAKVDIGSKEEIFCLQDGTFTDLDAVPGDYSDCDWEYYVEGSLREGGLKNVAVIVRDVSYNHHYKMRFVENELPTITFEYERID
jgi:hypothetical protein